MNPILRILFLFLGPLSALYGQESESPNSYERVLHLPEGQFLNEVVEENGRVVAQIVEGEASREVVLDGGPVLTIEAGSSRGNSGPATHLSHASEVDAAENAGEPCDLDWQDVVKDPPEGLMHVETSLDGCTVLLFSRDESDQGKGSVCVFKNGGGFKTVQFTDLIQATLNPAGDLVLVQAEGKFQVYWTKDFLAGRRPRTYATTGEKSWSIKYIDPNNSNTPGLFLLNKKLSAELYCTRPQEDFLLTSESSREEDPTRLAEFIVATSDYAVAVDYDPSSRLMVVAERNRLRVARLVGEKKAVFLIDHKIDPRSGVEIRSCKLDLATAHSTDGSRVRVALGLRRNVTRPSLRRAGSCEVQFLVLLAGEGASVSTSRTWPAESKAGQLTPEAQVLFQSKWEAADRFRADSPSLLFAREGAALFASTRDQAWRCEVVQ
ncbi:MAG: hypothetical protein AAF368_07795 [Planctomycetota bacterium]